MEEKVVNPRRSAKTTRDQTNTDVKAKLAGLKQMSVDQDSPEAFRPTNNQANLEQPKLGRRPLGAGKRSERVTITFTAEEMRLLKEEAQREPIGTYIRRRLEDNNIIPKSEPESPTQ